LAFKKSSILHSEVFFISLIIQEFSLRLELLIFATPLYQAGLQIPQYLQFINQHKINYQDFSSYAFLSKIKSGDKINIAVKQENTKQNKIYTVKAKKYQRQLDYYSEKNGFAIIRIDEFREGMQKKLSRFLKKINNKKPLIIDLRYCPGGDLFAAVDMLSPFLGKSKTVAYLQKDKSYRPVSLKSIQTQRLLTQPIYLLSSSFTASSAEVFIRAIKQNVKNSYIVGVPTQGK
jgi:carboxyl-terminal processing protease